MGKHRLGPLVVYAKDEGIVQAVRNLRGVNFCSVYELNLLQLAPGGHVGRLIIWTEGAFKALNELYGTRLKQSVRKKGYRLPRSIMKNSDLERIINSHEIQSMLKPKKRRYPDNNYQRKRNPLKDPELYADLNPLFERRLKKMKEDGVNVKVPTTKLLEEQKVKLPPLTAEEKEQMKPYWKTVFGTDKIFKSAKLLQAEKDAVKAAIAAQEREKAGLDLMEALGGDEEEDDS